MLKEVETAIEEIKLNKITSKTKKLIEKLFFSFSSNNLKNIDVILVLGSDGNHRIKTALEIYKLIKCPILCSGGAVTKGKYKEAERYKKILLKENVNEKDILLEAESLNSYENIKNSFPLIKRTIKKKHIGILIISSNFHLLRVKAIVDKFIKNKEFEFYNVYYYPSFSNKMKLDKWFKYKELRNDIAIELEKLSKYYTEAIYEKLF